jgi:hypothetical protein
VIYSYIVFRIALLFLTFMIVAFDGALGSVAINSLKNPRQLLNIKPAPSTTTSENAAASLGVHLPPLRFSYKLVLSSIERIYMNLIGMEMLYREWEDGKANGAEEKSEEQQQQW